MASQGDGRVLGRGRGRAFILSGGAQREGAAGVVSGGRGDEAKTSISEASTSSREEATPLLPESVRRSPAVSEPSTATVKSAAEETHRVVRRPLGRGTKLATAPQAVAESRPSLPPIRGRGIPPVSPVDTKDSSIEAVSGAFSRFELGAASRAESGAVSRAESGAASRTESRAASRAEAVAGAFSRAESGPASSAESGPASRAELGAQAVRRGQLTGSPRGTEQRVEPPSPPKDPVLFRGSTGLREEFVVNYLPIRTKKDFTVYEYHVSFSPEVDSRSVRFKIMNSLAERIGATKTFDGAKLCIPRRLQDKVVIVQAVHPENGSDVSVTLRLVGERSGKDCEQHFNILLRRAMHVLDMVQIGRHHYNPKLNIPIPKHNLSVWPGFITSIAEFEGGLMLCAETSHRVLRTNSVSNILYDLMSKYPRDYQNVAEKNLLGSVVITHYNNKHYRIDEISWKMNPMSTFKRGDQEITFVDYYRTQYGIEVKDRKQPLLMHRIRNKFSAQPDQERILSTIPEMCFLTGLTDDMRSDFRLMRDLQGHTRLSPNERQEELIRFIEQINSCPKAKEYFDAWGVELVPELKKVPGRMLPEEKINYGQNSVLAGKDANWSGTLVRSSLLKPVHIDNWAFIFTRQNQNQARDFAGQLQQVCGPLGMRIGRPYLHTLENDSLPALAAALKDVINSELQLVVVVNPTPRDDRYTLIKKICCVEKPVPSQVINSKTISDQRKLRSVTQKIALQLNCKLGGELWSVNIPMTGLMVCGMDSYHEKASENKSVLGFVASMNATLTRWFCDAKFQSKGEEIGSHLNVSLVRSLKNYYTVNHALPNKIIFIRDGVSDGQLNYVTDYEISQFTKAFQAFENYNPQFMVVVVQKRINTRIFSQMNGRGGRAQLNNPPPGTVVDQDVTRKYMCDFFLVSQHVTQGTVTPTHYIVVFNSIMVKDALLSADRIQQIIYKLTHLYYNWPGTVRVPAPCQYAHKLASLVGQNIRREPSEELMDRLFFL